jgi:hypothetical protein
MTGHQVSRPATRSLPAPQPRPRSAGTDQSSSSGPSVRAVPPLLAFLSTADYAEQQATSTTADQRLHPYARHNPAVHIKPVMLNST